jgi:hypothetical protein
MRGVRRRIIVRGQRGQRGQRGKLHRVEQFDAQQRASLELIEPDQRTSDRLIDADERSRIQPVEVLDAGGTAPPLGAFGRTGWVVGHSGREIGGVQCRDVGVFGHAGS